MRIKLTLEYDGTNYFGWQLQAGQDTIQAQLEAVLNRIFGREVRVYAAGRTDAGVHALGQVAAFDSPRAFEVAELRRALNAMLPRDIAVKEASEVRETFDPRREAVSRTYEYRIHNHETRSALSHRFSWNVAGPLDFEAMQQAAALFIGEHDFAAFRTLGSEVKSTVRKVFVSNWKLTTDELVYRVEAGSFLRHMVRTMVAVMVEAGRGKLQASSVKRLLEGADRSEAPAAAPPCGLFLVEVRYANPSGPS
jgi:tRNA pseudouridine38-40 synthase